MSTDYAALRTAHAQRLLPCCGLGEERLVALDLAPRCRGPVALPPARLAPAARWSLARPLLPVLLLPLRPLPLPRYLAVALLLPLRLPLAVLLRRNSAAGAAVPSRPMAAGRRRGGGRLRHRTGSGSALDAPGPCCGADGGFRGCRGAQLRRCAVARRVRLLLRLPVHHATKVLLILDVHRERRL